MQNTKVSAESILFSFTQLPQLERKHDTENSDDEESKRNHVHCIECSNGRLPQYQQRAKDGKDSESHVPAPVTGAVAFQVDGIAGGGEAAEHKPKGYDERNDFHADHRVGDEINAQYDVYQPASNIPTPTGDTLFITEGEYNFQYTACQHGCAEYDA